MFSVFNAHIFKQRTVGEREEVKLKIFGPNGQPFDLTNLGGGGEGSTTKMLLDSWQQNLISHGDNQVALSLGGNGIQTQQGFELTEGDTSFAAPAGAYFVSLSFNPSWEGDPPESGFMLVMPQFDYVDGDGNPNSLIPFTIQIGVDYDPTRPNGGFDGPFMQDGFVKQGVLIAPFAGEFSVQALQNAIPGDVSNVSDLIVIKF